MVAAAAAATDKRPGVERDERPLPAADTAGSCSYSFLGSSKTPRDQDDDGDDLTHRQSSSHHVFDPTSDQARLPAEFKHINKRRKRN